MNQHLPTPATARAARMRTSHGRLALLAIALVVSAGCATAKPPEAALQAARQAIAQAEQARVAEFAALDLAEARARLADAEAHVQKKDMDNARRLAEQAEAAAQLASAKAAVARSRAINEEMQRGTRVLQQEMERSNGAGS